MKLIKASIVILTKNRAEYLKKNLSSLNKQTVKPWEVIIINNNSTDKTEKIIENYKQKLPIKSYKTNLTGYPQLYNFGIQKTKGSLIVFLDDDCIAQKNWLEQLIKAHHKHPREVIQGQTFSLPKNNIYAQIMGRHYQNWLKANLIDKNELRFLDNKNAAIPKKILTACKGFSKKCFFGSEDLELGIRLRKRGIKIIFQPKAIAHHYERTNFKQFILQHYRIAKSETKLNRILKDGQVEILPKKKSLLNLYSALGQELINLKNGRVIEFIQLPIIYLSLFGVRVYGYIKSKT